MFTGIAVLGVLAGSLSALFRIDEGTAPTESQGTLQDELSALRTELQGVEQRLGELAERAGPS